MRGSPIPIALLLMLSACADRDPTPEERQRQDEVAIEAVKAAQVPPPVPTTPESILYPDIEKYDLFGAGCNFAPKGSIGAIALAQPAHGFMKIDGELVSFAPDAGSARLPLDSRGKYTSGAWSFVLDIAEGEGKQNGTEMVAFPAHLTLRNQRDQIVYESPGTAQCGS